MKEYVYQFILTLPEVETTSLAVNQYIKRYKRNKEFPEKDGFFSIIDMCIYFKCWQSKHECNIQNLSC